MYPVERGYRPGAGAVVAAIEVAAQRSPAITIGKPEPHLLVAAAAVVGADVRQAVMIGDALYSDMAAARNVGCRSVLMLTGVTSRATADALPAAERPTAIAADADELAAVLAQLAGG
jgi:ribonucleotide monophosphatase NagD (HAD superfamily)